MQSVVCSCVALSLIVPYRGVADYAWQELPRARCVCAKLSQAPAAGAARTTRDRYVPRLA
ncbi:hypothetical protein IscW_ISCW015510 [Ixodes scapularis]|uniref:Secreted protein n=1 Tax=Ixodes scapularis TaxID=6945 RepID=B7QMY9_IXOSC|nr:hypothetical protein IscW_ISCW015510 [Ixodes scapularis]|eukprot:XP_002400415.1 hypothetical protein IscW_ISCW015510 [Ixodes scapularis]